MVPARPGAQQDGPAPTVPGPPPASVPPVPGPPQFAPPAPHPPAAAARPAARSRRTPALVAAAVGAALVLTVVTVAVGSSRDARQPTGATSTSAAARPAPADGSAGQYTEPSAQASASAAGVVQLTASAADRPAAGAVLALLDRHFTAINDRDYDTWATTVVSRRARQQPRDAWAEDYRSTHDSDVRVLAIDDAGPDAVTVELSFVSEQDLADAPANLPGERICWRSRWPVVAISSGGRLDTPPKGSTTGQPC